MIFLKFVAFPFTTMRTFLAFPFSTPTTFQLVNLHEIPYESSGYPHSKLLMSSNCYILPNPSQMISLKFVAFPYTTMRTFLAFPFSTTTTLQLVNLHGITHGSCGYSQSKEFMSSIMPFPSQMICLKFLAFPDITMRTFLAFPFSTTTTLQLVNLHGCKVVVVENGKARNVLMVVYGKATNFNDII